MQCAWKCNTDISFVFFFFYFDVMIFCLIMSSHELATDEISSESAGESDEESSWSEGSDRLKYSSSSDNDKSSDRDSAEEIEILEDYQPEEGAESNDDRNECCHWSTQQTEHSRILKRKGIPKSEGPRRRYPNQTSSSGLPELLLDETFIDHVFVVPISMGKGKQSFWNWWIKLWVKTKFPVMTKK